MILALIGFTLRAFALVMVFAGAFALFTGSVSKVGRVWFWLVHP